MDRILTATWGLPGGHTLAVYRSHGGYGALAKALAMTPEAIVDQVKAANLRGRGGAGFPCGVKWGFLPKDLAKPRYLVVNADEGEPGTFKDRAILEKDPHRLLEGILITAYALKVETAYVYLRGEFGQPGQSLTEAIGEATQAGYLGTNILGSGYSLEIVLHYGAGAYICGEETALLESIEGKPGKPRPKPPFPAVVGLFGCPTIINNVETLACIPTIIERGGEWFHKLGRERDGGTKIYGVSGHVKRPGLYEAPLGLSLRTLVYDLGGGIRDDRPLKAVIPGGVSCVPLKPDEIDVTMDFASMTAAGTMLGTAGAIVMDVTTCMVRMATRIARFYHHESCGQCTPCREGSGWILRILEEIEAGRGSPEDLDLLVDICNHIQGNTICAFGDALAMPIRGYVTKFESEFLRHLEKGGCPFPAW
ncbi:MAG: NADH-quinone oxidoreductase subunit NuoF [Bradymonadales bacterium]|nr:NADH-quinone oxidoreductase subunit NuoF [Bradymonadales bacterium]